MIILYEVLNSLQDDYSLWSFEQFENALFAERKV